MNPIDTYLLFVVLYGLVMIGLFVVMRKELKKIQKELKGDKR
jgi:hypothetical protein